MYVCAATNGVVIATEKKLPSVLVDETQVRKIEPITPHTGKTYTTSTTSSSSGGSCSCSCSGGSNSSNRGSNGKLYQWANTVVIKQAITLVLLLAVVVVGEWKPSNLLQYTLPLAGTDLYQS